MKRVFDLGMSAVPYLGRRRRLTIEVEFGGQWFRKPGEGYFALSGQIGGKNRYVSCGQCQSDIRRICKKKWHKLLDELLAFDKKYWLWSCKCIPENDANRIIEIINS